MLTCTLLLCTRVLCAALLMSRFASASGARDDDEWWSNAVNRNDALKGSHSLWADRSLRRKAPTVIKHAARWTGTASDSRKPVIIVTGGIACGRTTLVRQLVAAARDARRNATDERVLAVITHRFWQEYGVTSPPPPDSPGALHVRHHSVFDFGNACICCAPDGDFQALLKRLCAEEDESTVPPCAAVIVETTGTADPAMFARILMQDDALAERFVLRSIVCVLDARTAVRAFAAPDLAGAKNPVRQMTLVADRVVLTHAAEAATSGAIFDPAAVTTRLKSTKDSASATEDCAAAADDAKIVMTCDDDVGPTRLELEKAVIIQNVRAREATAAAAKESTAAAAPAAEEATKAARLRSELREREVALLVIDR